MSIGAICNRKVITTQRNTSVLDAAILMRKHHVGDVVVIETKKEKIVPIGIVTDRDIVMDVVATALDCKVMTVGDIMVENFLVINKNVDIFVAIKTMTSKGVRRLPVVDNKGQLVGIATLDDLLLFMTKQFGLLSKLHTREQKNESSQRR